jgi:hypothetical protein
MLTRYVRVLYEGSHGRDDQRIANLVVALVDRGRKLLPPNGELAGAH